MVTSAPMVLVRDLWEEFRVLEDRAGSVKELLARFRIARERKVFWALRGLSFEIGPGETVGLIGPNGSGKSTLLRCIAGILPPSRGDVLVGGAVASLIELGAGFHPELTGRENAEVSGVLFGLSRAELHRRFDEIVSFAELEDVIDHPVRSYSSGMYVRLAFSLAVHTSPDVLLIDEVLAVGDASFQRKCIGRVRELREQGITIVFVSHDMPLVQLVCDRCLLLQEGRLAADGAPEEVVRRYFELEQIEVGDRIHD